MTSDGLLIAEQAILLLAVWSSRYTSITPLLNRWLSSLGVAHRLALDGLSHRDGGLRVLLPLLTILPALLTVLPAILPGLLALLTRLPVLLAAGSWGVAIHWALLLFEALVHEARDEAEGGQEDKQQDDGNHACAGHSLALAAPHLQQACLQSHKSGLSLLQ